jgi:small subunit ribosomal protein S2
MDRQRALLSDALLPVRNQSGRAQTEGGTQVAGITMKHMLEAGVHFGHQTSKWDPKMKPYIFGARNGIHIIDLQKTVVLFKEAYAFIVETVARGGSVLFVGTKRQAQEAIQDEALRAKMFCVTNRWLGGFLTNFQTIKKSIERMTTLEAMRDDGSFENFKKKEVLGFEREIEKLNFIFNGIRDMKSLPSAIFVVDPKKEKIAVSEANKLGIPIVALLDTNADPYPIDYLIPGNDDAIRAIKLFSARIADACLEGERKRQERIQKQAEEAPIESPEVVGQDAE